MDSHSEKELTQPHLPVFEPTALSSLDKQKEKQARAAFDLKLKKIEVEQPEVGKKYHEWLLDTQLLWGKNRPVHIAVNDREKILEYAIKGEKPIWLDPERRKKEEIERRVEAWQQSTNR